MIRKDIKAVYRRQQQKIDENKVKIIKQNKQDLYIKIQKIQKQGSSLNLDIKYLLEERNLKENIQKILLKQRKGLQNCFLFKKSQNFKQSNEIKENQSRQILQQVGNGKNRFKDVNQRIIHFIQHVQVIKQGNPNQYSIQTNSQHSNNQSSQKLQCQSLHIKQIFNSENSLNHQAKVSKLKQKLSSLYQKVKINLQRQEPYLHQKIIERIRRQAQKQSRQKLLVETQQLIKQNSKWMSQQTNMMSNQLQQKQIQNICVNNLGLMKKIMSKKVNNNDFIFENYSKIDEKYPNVVKTFPMSKVSERFSEVLKKLQQDKISEQLMMFDSEGQSDKKEIQNSFKQILQNSVYINLFKNQQTAYREFDEQNEFIQRLKQITGKIDGLLKS